MSRNRKPKPSKPKSGNPAQAAQESSTRKGKPGSAARPPSRLVTLPFVAPVSMEDPSPVPPVMLPWQVSERTGIWGKVKDADEEVVVIVGEWPIPYWPSFGGEVARADHERLHIERCFTDYLLATGKACYDSLAEGPDPPDFIATALDGSTTGIDATQLTSSRRIMAEAQFERIRAAMIRQPRDRLAKLRGHQIYIWFETEEGTGLPRTRKPEEVDEVVKALCEYEPATSWLQAAEDGGFPDFSTREADIQETGSNCRFYAVDFRDAFPATDFYMRTGFELALGFQTLHAIDDAWTELARLVEQKDKRAIQNLIVTVGGPNRRGLAYPSSLVLFNAAMAHVGLPRLAPKHLEEVIVHSWGSGTVTQVYPGPAKVFGPLYQGYVPPFLVMRGE